MLFCLFAVIRISAQTTAFTYQGSLKEGASAANGNYDFEFKLFNLASGGAPQGGTLQQLNVAVANGIFAVSLDFGAAPLPGANRFLEIGVRMNGNPGGFQQLIRGKRWAVRHTLFRVLTLRLPLTPPRLQRQRTQHNSVVSRQINSCKLAIRVYRMPAIRSPEVRTIFKIKTPAPQATSNFNISGNGTAGGTISGGVVNAATQYNIGGNRVFSTAGSFNLFAGVGAGAINTSDSNSFFGHFAGRFNTNGSENSFFGYSAGTANTSASNNAFFGTRAGRDTTMGSGNSFVGYEAGLINTEGVGNSFFGRSAGSDNTTGHFNSSFGRLSGANNQTGSYNTFIGYNATASFLSTDLSFATAIGAGSVVNLSNSVFIGRPGGEDTVRIPGNVNVTGSTSLNGNLTFASGGIASISSANVFMTQLPAGVGTTLCRTASNQIVTCSSSLRYKTNINRFGLGLDLVNQLKPITFDWKDGGMHDLGLGAEDVAAIEPLLVTYNDKGQVEGVKYDRVGVVLINAVKEQQEKIETQQLKNQNQDLQIERLTQQIRMQEMVIDGLRKLVCSQNTQAEICKEISK